MQDDVTVSNEICYSILNVRRFKIILYIFESVLEFPYVVEGVSKVSFLIYEQ